MIEKLIRDYVNKITIVDVDLFAKSNGIILTDKEIELVYFHIKNNWQTIIYGNPQPILNELKENLNEVSYQKVENLYIDFKNKYENYL